MLTFVWNLRERLPPPKCLLLSIAEIRGARRLAEYFGPLFTKYKSLKLVNFYSKVKYLYVIGNFYIIIIKITNIRDARQSQIVCVFFNIVQTAFDPPPLVLNIYVADF